MPRGKYVSHKGKHRRFNNPEEIQEQMQKMQKEQEWRKQHPDESSGDEAGGKDDKAENSGSSDESSSDGEEGKAKGVQHLIQIENPNRIQKKSKKVTEIDIEGAASSAPLSRREREELEKQRAAANYQRLHAMGKTDEARADLARLAIIKQQREEAAKRREQELKEKESAKQSKTEQTQKAMGKKKT